MIKVLRRLAKSPKYQFLFAKAKELGNIRLFENLSDLTPIQIRFLQWLTIYNSLYQDLSNKEDYISEEVIQDDLRTDAYILYKNTKTKEPKLETKTPLQKNMDSSIPSVIFKKAGKK